MEEAAILHRICRKNLAMTLRLPFVLVAMLGFACGGPEGEPQNRRRTRPAQTETQAEQSEQVPAAPSESEPDTAEPDATEAPEASGQNAENAPEQPSEAEGTSEEGGEAEDEEGAVADAQGDTPEVLEAGDGLGEDELRGLEQTIETALEAARDAEGAASVCVSAYQSIVAMVRAVAARYPDNVAPIPPEEAFMGVCEDLPEPVQNCLVASYAVEHQDECGQAQAALPPEMAERLQQVLSGQ